MDRRSFLRGTFGGVVAGGIIVAASDAEIAKFASGVIPETPIDLSPKPNDEVWAQMGEWVYNHKGQIIGVVNDIEVSDKPVGITSFANPHSEVMMSGLKRVTYTVLASGFAPVRTSAPDR